MVARAALDDATSARQIADNAPTEENLRVAYRACVFAARALRGASQKDPGQEQAMIERSILLDEESALILRKLARFGESSR